MERTLTFQSAVSKSVSLCFQTCTVTGAFIALDRSSNCPSFSFILALILGTCFCESAVEACAERLIVPIWNRVRRCQSALALEYADLDPTSTHRLCTLPQNKRESYATPNVRVSRSRAPPPAPLASKQ